MVHGKHILDGFGWDGKSFLDGFPWDGTGTGCDGNRCVCPGNSMGWFGFMDMLPWRRVVEIVWTALTC